MKTFLIHNFLFSFIEIMDLVILGGGSIKPFFPLGLTVELVGRMNVCCCSAWLKYLVCVCPLRKARLVLLS